MQDTYYVQRQAKRLLAQMIPVPADIDAPPEATLGLSREAFLGAFRDAHAVLRRIYETMRAAPESFGLPLHALDGYRPASKEARDSQRAVYGPPNLLYCLGLVGKVQGDGLTVDQGAFKAAVRDMRVKNLPPLVEGLRAHGYAFSGWSGKRFAKGVDPFFAEYPANPQVMVVLKAMATQAPRLPNWAHRASSHFRLMDYRLLGASAEAAPRFDLKDLAHAVGDEGAPFLYAFHAFMTDRGHGYLIDDELDKLQYLDAKGKPTLDYLRFTDYRYGGREGLLLLRLKLNHASTYNDYVEACPDHIKQGFRDAWKCQHCREECNRRVSYRIDGAWRESCICEAFPFFAPRLEDMAYYQELFDLEQSARQARKRPSR